MSEENKSKAKRILICGDRNWDNWKVIEDFIKNLPKDTIIIDGKCRGADKIASYIATKYGLVILEFPADWNKYGKAAGPIRNKQMLDEAKPDLVVAFYNNIEASKGTKCMIELAKKAGVPVKIIGEKK